ncbi:TPA: hypothetical protein ACFIRY_001812, partial [Neisseria gonorrhoeae]
VRERATSRKACIWAAKVLGKIATSENALPPALPHGGEQVAAGFAVAGDLKGNLDLQLLFQVV